MTRPFFPVVLPVVLGVASCIGTVAFADNHGFADVPGGGARDPRIELIASTGAGGTGEVVVPGDDAFDPCGAYGFDDALQMMTAKTSPGTLPQALASPESAWIALRFPFPIDAPKTVKTILKDKPELAPTSFLVPNVTITDESGAHVPCIAVVGGRNAQGDLLADDADFPVHLVGGVNVLASKRTLLLVADDGDQQLASACNFAPVPGQPATSAVREIRVRVERVGGTTIHGCWVVKIGDAGGEPVAPQAPLRVEGIEATGAETPAHFVDGHLVVAAASRFVVAFSEPVDPWSAGVSKSLAKEFGIPFLGNLGVTLHPCSTSATFPQGDPLFPALRLEVTPKGKAPFLAAFNVRPINPNNLAEYVVDPVGKLPQGTVRLRAIPLQENVNFHQGVQLSSAVTSLYGMAFADLSGVSDATFSVGD